MKSRRNATLLEVINKSIIWRFCRDFDNDKKDTNRSVAFGHICLRNIPKHKNFWWESLKPGKQDPFKHIFKWFTNDFGVNTAIWSGPGALEESQLVVAYVTILGGTGVLRSFKYIQKGKVGKKKPVSSRSQSPENI